MSSPVPEPDDPTPIDPVTDPPIDPVQEPGIDHPTTDGSPDDGEYADDGDTPTT